MIAEKRGGVRRTYVPDPLGSTVALLDNTQTKTDTFTYWPYGELNARTGTTPTPFQFVGTLGYYAETNRNYVRSRFLQPATARWLSEDPLRDSWHWYAYCENSPLTQVDPSGLSINFECKCSGRQRQKAIADAFKSICNSRAIADIDSCIADNCKDLKGMIDCISGFCTRSNGRKITVRCNDKKKGYAEGIAETNEIILHGSAWNAGSVGGLACILLHELIHLCGHDHYLPNSRGYPQTIEEDCLCSNCTYYFNKRCRTFIFNGIYGWEDCAGLGTCPTP
ncbi:MAG: RHS repeat domain-containing protein [Fimbriimonadales bacterium]